MAVGIAVLGAVWPAAAQPPPDAPDAAPHVSPIRARDGRPARRGDVGTFVLANGQLVEGRLLTSTALGSVIRRDTGERLFLGAGELVAVVPPGGTAWGGLEDGEARAFLEDGRVVRGRVVDRTSRTLVLETPEGQVALAADELRDAYSTGGGRLRLLGRADVAAQRAVWAPTAFTPAPGAVTLSSAQLLQTSVSVGLPLGVVASASTTMPAWFASELDWNGSLGVRVGREVVSGVHVSCGAVTFLSGEGRLASVTASATVGSRDRYLSVYGGPPPASADALGAFGDRILAVSGGWRVARRASVIAEGWLGPEALGSERLGAIAARFLGSRFSVDLGAAYAPARGVLPFLGLELAVGGP